MIICFEMSVFLSFHTVTLRLSIYLEQNAVVSELITKADLLIVITLNHKIKHHKPELG